MKTFIKELIITNYILLCLFAGIIIVGNIVYGGNLITISKTLPIFIIIVLVMLLKIRRIKANPNKIDERLQIITYKAVNIAFYLLIGVIFWFYTKELVIIGQISARTIAELVAVLVGYIGGLLFLSKKY